MNLPFPKKKSYKSTVFRVDISFTFDFQNNEIDIARTFGIIHNKVSHSHKGYKLLTSYQYLIRIINY